MAVKKKKNYNKTKSNKKNNYNKSKNTVKKNNSKKSNYNKSKSNKKNVKKRDNINNISSNIIDESSDKNNIVINNNNIDNKIDDVVIELDSNIDNELDKSNEVINDIDLLSDNDTSDTDEIINEEVSNIDVSNVNIDREDTDDIDDNIDSNIDLGINNNLDGNIGNDINNSIDNTSNIDNASIGNRGSLDKKKGYRNVLFILIFVFILGIGAIYFPKIELSGDSEMVISYKDKYVEPGYKMEIMNKDITDKINIDGKVLDGVVGEYELNYFIDLFGIKFSKKRDVIVVDKDNPSINVESDVINVCPNKDVPNFKYSAIDEYDGDITTNVEKVVNDNDIVLNVSDSSGNSISKKILIDRVDSISPVIKLKGSSVMFVNYGDKYIEPGYNVSDNCSDNLDSKVKISGSVGREIGTYNLTYEVVDDSGNKSSVNRRVIVGTKVVDNGSVNNGTIYLTFDDGPNNGTTNKILDILKEEGVKATFFVTCNGSDSLIKRMYDEGHTVALHTASHNYANIYSSVDNYFNDLNKVSDRVKRITGIDSKIIRFPGGSSNMVSRNYRVGIMTELSNLVLNYGYKYFDWNVDGMDASSARNSSDVYYNVTSNLNMNRANVVLMHDTKSITVGAVRDIIRFGKNNGYSFNKIDMNTKMVRHSVNN